MGDRQSPRECRRLRSHEIEHAVEALAEHPDWREKTAGFRHITEEPELYNKWLFGVRGDRSAFLLIGLAWRFCPTDNQPYVGLTPYHPPEWLYPVEMDRAVRTQALANKFLRLPKKQKLGEGVVR